MRKKDMRIERTQNSIKSAFLSLLETENYSKITIQEIADVAMINRNTFYLHYKDKAVLLKTIIDEHIEELNNALEQEFLGDEEYPEIIVLEKISSALTKDKYFFKVMFICTENGYFFDSFENAISKVILKTHKFHFDKLSQNYVDAQLAFINSGIIGLMKYNIHQDKNLTPLEMAEIAHSLFFTVE